MPISTTAAIPQTRGANHRVPRPSHDVNDDTILVHTTARCRGLPVTVIGDLSAGLIAIAGYRTAHEQAIAILTVHGHGPHRTYAVHGNRRRLASLTEAAVLAAQLRETTDRDRRTPGGAVEMVRTPAD